MDHPLKVYFPHGGKHFVAQFWTHNEQNQIVVARSLSALDRTLNLLIEEDCDLQVNEILEVNIVSPPESLCEMAKIEARRILTSQFFKLITFYIKELVDNKFEMPKAFKPCPKWETEYKDISRKDDKNHLFCKNCYEKIALNALSPEEFYEKYHSKWESIFENRKPFVNELAVYSYAGSSTAKDELWYVDSDFGHHSSGVRFRLVDMADKCVNTYPVLFYFHKIKEIDNSKYTDLLKKNKTKKQKKEKLNKIKFAEHLKKEKEERYNKISKIFEE
jgi:hypothetical protein